MIKATVDVPKHADQRGTAVVWMLTRAAADNPGMVALAACYTGLLHKWRVATSYAVFAVVFALLV